MNNQSNRQVDCLNRMFELVSNLDEFVSFLVDAKVIEKSELITFKQESDKGRFLYHKMKDGQAKELLMLVDFEWSILPVERITITMVTPRDQKIFQFN